MGGPDAAQLERYSSSLTLMEILEWLNHVASTPSNRVGNRRGLLDRQVLHVLVCPGKLYRFGSSRHDYLLVLFPFSYGYELRVK